MLPVLVSLNVFILVDGSGLLCCTWVTTVCLKVIAAVTVTRKSGLTLRLLIVFFIVIVFDFKLLPKCFAGSVVLRPHCIVNTMNLVLCMLCQPSTMICRK